MIINNARILVVDDFEMVRITLKNCLTQLGYTEVDEAIDGKQAFAMLDQGCKQNKPYTVVFSDLNMPRLNGLDFLVACRKDPRFKKLPFVMISAEGERQSVVQALQHGANDYLIKPFSTEMLQKKLEKIAEQLNKATAA